MSPQSGEGIQNHSRKLSQTAADPSKEARKSSGGRNSGASQQPAIATVTAQSGFVRTKLSTMPCGNVNLFTQCQRLLYCNILKYMDV